MDYMVPEPPSGNSRVPVSFQGTQFHLQDKPVQLVEDENRSDIFLPSLVLHTHVDLEWKQCKNVSLVREELIQLTRHSNNLLQNDESLRADAFDDVDDDQSAVAKTHRSGHFGGKVDVA